MCLGIDRTVIGYGIDLRVLANLGDCVGFGGLKLLDELVHDIEKDDLGISISLIVMLFLHCLPHNQTDEASLLQNHDRCSHHQNVLL